MAMLCCKYHEWLNAKSFSVYSVEMFFFKLAWLDLMFGLQWLRTPTEQSRPITLDAILITLHYSSQWRQDIKWINLTKTRLRLKCKQKNATPLNRVGCITGSCFLRPSEGVVKTPQDKWNDEQIITIRRTGFGGRDDLELINWSEFLCFI